MWNIKFELPRRVRQRDREKEKDTLYVLAFQLREKTLLVSRPCYLNHFSGRGNRIAVTVFQTA